MRYYLAPWQWDVGHAIWRSPFDQGAGAIDLRARSQVRADGIAEGYGLFATLAPQGVRDAVDLGDALDGALDGSTMRRELDLGEKLVATTLRGAIFELLTMHADPAVAERWGCLMPTRQRRCEIWLGGKIIDRRLRPGRDAEWPVIRQRLRHDYRAIKTRADAPNDPMPAGQHRRVLSVWRRKYGIENHEEFIPRDLPNETPLRPATTVSDNFNRANENLEASADWVLMEWANGEVPSLVVAGNEVESDTTAASTSIAEHQTSLSTDDHYAEVEITAFVQDTNSKSAGAMVRVHDLGSNVAGGYSHNIFRGGGANTGRIMRHESPAGTQLTSYTPTLSIPDTLRCEADGSTIRALLNGAQQLSTTDTTYSGQLQVGLEIRRRDSAAQGDVSLDDFAGGDLSTPETVNVGVGRDLWTGQTLVVNERDNIAIGAGVDVWAGAALGVNEKTFVQVPAGVDLWEGKAVTVQADENVPIGVGRDLWEGKDLTVQSAEEIGVGRVLWAGTDVVVNERENVPIGAGVDAWQGKDLTVTGDEIVSIGVGRQLWQGTEVRTGSDAIYAGLHGVTDAVVRNKEDIRDGLV